MSFSFASAAEGRPANRGFVTVCVMLATIMQALDTSIANVALPHMQGSLGATQDQIAWVLTSYIVAAAVATPLTGWLAGRYGRKRLFLAAIIGFTVSSLLCGVAQSLTEIVIDRLLQGVFGAALVPVSQAILLDVYPRERHGQAMAVWGAGIVVAPILGPTLGGWLTDTYTWRWVFLINLPVGVLTVAGVWAFVSETALDRDRPFDFFGFAMLSLAIGALQMMLDRGETNDWFGSTETWIELALAVASLWVFIVHAATTDHPFVSLALFRDRNFVAGSVLMFLIGILLYGTLALFPELLQDVMGYPVMTAGMVLAPRGIGTLLAMLVVGRLTGRFDARLILLVGFAVTAYSLWRMTGYSVAMDMRPVLGSTIIQGFGLGLVWVPLSTASFATLPARFRTEASAFSSLVRNVGGSVGIAVGENVLVRNVQINHASLAEHANPFNPMLSIPSVQHAWNLHTTSGLASLNFEITQQAKMIAYNDVFQLLMILTLTLIPLLLMLTDTRGKGGSDAHVALD
ncbi:MAG TPA: DHA2 family efflux MFS transporter permease subunit [Stellaceae bacterium]|nr:DHA2 family efflux MFS transporter permease subunit [Stellaceae bacterium]